MRSEVESLKLMTIKYIRNKLKELEAVVLADGKVDYVEAIALRDFIAPYVASGISCFVEFNTLLNAALSDGKIDEHKSNAIVQSIHKVMDRLKIEQLIERIFLSVGLVILSCYACYVVWCKFFA